MRISAPAQWFSPWTNAIGPRIAIFMACAWAAESKIPASANAASPAMNERSMVLLLCTTLYLKAYVQRRDEIVGFARQFDPQPFQTDRPRRNKACSARSELVLGMEG